ncbi:MAG: exo-alpha-sialidase [Clostridia bacterium]|nr:exo-alpha-sialidase [Clostridia bacterium]
MPKLTWSHRPYIQFRYRGEDRPFICAIRPKKGGFSFDYFDSGAKSETGCSLRLRRRFSGGWEATAVSGGTADVSGLCDYAEYEFYLVSDDGRQSDVRLVRTGEPIGTVVNYIHPNDGAFAFSGQYYCSPSLLRLKSGRLLASYDVFKGSAPQCLNVIFASDDDGKTWKYLCDLFPSFWGKLFTVNGRLYMLSVAHEYGDLMIGESEDEGLTWKAPTVIEYGPGHGKSGFHRAPCVYAVAAGRIWFAVENGSWNDGGFTDCLVSAPVDCDLLDAESWTFTKPLPFDGNWLCGGRAQVIEGNPFVGNDGELYVLYRNKENVGMLMRADKNDPEKQLEFVKTVALPFAHTKFDIHRGGDGYFYAAGNECDGDGLAARNVLSFFRSDDGVSYERIMKIIDCADHDKKYTGFQYPSFIVEDSTVSLLSRTAYNGAANFHDSNMITFHRFTIPE